MTGMSPARQLQTLGASVKASDDLVIMQVGTSATSMSPSEAKTFIRCAAREMYRAEIVAFSRELEDSGQ